MPKAICIRATRHFKFGDIVEVPNEKHPFIVSGSFKMIEEEKPKYVYTEKSISKKKKWR
jgi:hypothetical protein